MNLGAGRVILQDLSRIDRAIEQGELKSNAALNVLFARVRHSGTSSDQASSKSCPARKSRVPA